MSSLLFGVAQVMTMLLMPVAVTEPPPAAEPACEIVSAEVYGGTFREWRSEAHTALRAGDATRGVVLLAQFQERVTELTADELQLFHFDAWALAFAFGNYDVAGSHVREAVAASASAEGGLLRVETVLKHLDAATSRCDRLTDALNAEQRERLTAEAKVKMLEAALREGSVSGGTSKPLTEPAGEPTLTVSPTIVNEEAAPLQAEQPAVTAP